MQRGGILYFILNNLSRSASGVIFARAEHIGVIPLPFVADEFFAIARRRDE